MHCGRWMPLRWLRSLIIAEEAVKLTRFALSSRGGMTRTDRIRQSHASKVALPLCCEAGDCRLSVWLRR